MTLEELLRESSGQSWPDFRIAIQAMRNYGEGGVRVLVHAIGRDSDTLDFVVVGNELRPVPSPIND